MDPKPLTTLARETFADDRYATSLTGIAIEHVGDHTAECSLAVASHHLNARDVVMGGVLFTMADFAAAIAANTDSLSAGKPLAWVSLDATIHYLAPSTGATLKAISGAMKHGRTTALYHTDLYCDDRRVAVVETTMMHV